MKLDIQFVMLAAGEKRYQEYFESMHKKFSSKMGIYIGYNDELAHLIEAGCDMYLMPSRYEPCGLNQLYSLKTGPSPSCGQQADWTTRSRISTEAAERGLNSRRYHSKELLKTIQRALKTYQDGAVWKKIMRNGMQQDFSWESSAKKYTNLYRNLAKQ